MDAVEHNLPHGPSSYDKLVPTNPLEVKSASGAAVINVPNIRSYDWEGTLIAP